MIVWCCVCASMCVCIHALTWITAQLQFLTQSALSSRLCAHLNLSFILAKTKLPEQQLENAFLQQRNQGDPEPSLELYLNQAWGKAKVDCPKERHQQGRGGPSASVSLASVNLCTLHVIHDSLSTTLTQLEFFDSGNIDIAWSELGDVRLSIKCLVYFFMLISLCETCAESET